MKSAVLLSLVHLRQWETDRRAKSLWGGNKWRSEWREINISHHRFMHFSVRGYYSVLSFCTIIWRKKCCYVSRIILLFSFARLQKTVPESQMCSEVGRPELLFLERFLLSFSNISWTELMYDPENKMPEVSRQWAAEETERSLQSLQSDCMSSNL